MQKFYDVRISSLTTANTETKMAITFGEKLKELRQKKEITIRSFASQIKISPSYLCDLERGYRPYPSAKSDLFERIVSVLNLSKQERDELEKLKDESIAMHGQLDPYITDYLKNTPSAQVVLRKAKEKGYSDEYWNRLIDE